MWVIWILESLQCPEERLLTPHNPQPSSHKIIIIIITLSSSYSHTSHYSSHYSHREKSILKSGRLNQFSPFFGNVGRFQEINCHHSPGSFPNGCGTNHHHDLINIFNFSECEDCWCESSSEMVDGRRWRWLGSPERPVTMLRVATAQKCTSIKKMSHQLLGPLVLLWLLQFITGRV